MPVPEQIPYVGYIANGQTTEFPITFDLHDPEFLIVTLNKEIPIVGAYTIDMNAKKVVFATAPNDNDQVELYRETELNRDTDYKSYDNSFRPEAVNYDLDKIIHMLQEQHMIDAELASRLKQEIEWRRTHDANFDELSKMRDAQVFSGLKQYADILFTMSQPNIFEGITAGIVFALDKKSVQTHLEIIYGMLESNHNDFESAINVEKTRALAAESILLQKIQNEVTRATTSEANLQLQISTSVGGIKYFETEAALNAFIPGETDPKQAYVFNTKKNYLWSGSTWTDEGLSALDESKKYTNEQIKKIGFVPGINIFDKSKVEIGKYYDYETGEKGNASEEYVAAGLYEVDGNTEYQVPSNFSQQFAFFDSNQIYVSGLLDAGPTHKFTTPSNAKYIGLTVDVVLLETFMLCKSSDYPYEYTPYYINNKELSINPNQVIGLSKNVDDHLGVEYINIIDPSKFVLNKYVDYTTGELANNNDFVAAGLYEIKPSTVYKFSSFYDQQGAFYNAKGIYISGFASPNAEHNITTPSTAKYIRTSIQKSQMDILVLAESELFPDSYVPFGSKIIQGLMVNTDSTTQITEIITSADTGDTSAEFTGKNAVQLALNSISNASFKKKYIIKAKGFHKLDTASDVIGYPGYPSMILAKDHVDIIGDGNTVFWLELPFNDADIGPSPDGNIYPRNRYQVLYSYAEDSLIQDVTFVAKNIRYALHLDNPGGANKRHDFRNVNFIFKGVKGSQQALGCGTSTGEQTYFDGGSCHSDYAMPFYCHNNTKFNSPSLMSFKNFKFSSNDNKYAAELQNDGSLVKDKVELIGCSFAGSAYVVLYDEAWLRKNTAQKYDSFDHAEWTFSGYGNDPFLFENNVEGLSLHFKTTGTGIDKSIRFDKASSAYPLLIKNNQTNTDVSLYLDSRDYIDGYIVQDGSISMSAQAWGCLDVSELAGVYESGVVYTSLGKRLGNCSTSNKTLGVIINGAANVVTFNKDYTSMSNSAIVSEINSALTGATVNLVSYGRDYYPIMPDVTEIAFNTTSSPILKGSVVTKSGGSVRLANGNEKIFGVALDDIPVVQTTVEGVKKGQGRVLKRGYISTNQTKSHFVLADNISPPAGTRFSVNSGQLVTDTNGKISVDIDTGVVSINC